MHCASLHKRRNLTADQRAVVGANVAERYRELTKERQVAGLRKGNEVAEKPEQSPLAQVETNGAGEAKRDALDERDLPEGYCNAGPNKPKPNDRKASALAAKEVGSSRSAVERAIALRREAPELAERVASGEMKLKQAEKERPTQQ